MNYNLDDYSPSKPSTSSSNFTNQNIDFNLKDYNTEVNYNVNDKHVMVESEINLDEYVIDNNTYVVNDDTVIKNESEVPSLTEKEEATKATVIDYGLAFLGSFVGNFLELGEGVVDSHIYGTTKTINAVKLDQAFGWDKNYDENIMGYDLSGIVQNAIDGSAHEDAKDSFASGAGEFLGKSIGYKALSSVPYVGIALCAFGGAGAQTEESINRQIEETGCVNDYTVFFDSLIGSIEGFGYGFIFNKGSAANVSIKNGGYKATFEGIKEMFSKGFKNGTWEFIKSVPKVFANTGKNVFKDPAAWAQTGGQLLEKFNSIYESGKISVTDILFPINPFKSVRIMDFFGKSGMDYLKDFKF